MPFDATLIGELIDSLDTASDAELTATVARLDKLRRLTAGSDRDAVIWAMGECKALLSPAGRLRRAVALAVHQVQAGKDVEAA
jgi:hypothetical protein